MHVLHVTIFLSGCRAVQIENSKKKLNSHFNAVGICKARKVTYLVEFSEFRVRLEQASTQLALFRASGGCFTSCSSSSVHVQWNDTVFPVLCENGRRFHFRLQLRN